ncbi:MAG: DNA gyrase subunit A, partial [Clostridia bacterium]
MANIENNESNYDRVIETSIEDVIHNSMIPYAEYVILDRAIPRVEDGLKPVQRRILYAMYELGITPEKPTRKSARIVGDCLGKFHPHGDTSVYGALVRMGQPFSIRNCLIEGQGNFGSVDGDSAAAMRYTEARLTPLAMELLRDIDKNTVEFTNNFDDTLIEPVTLPGRFPNLLVNGASGIAVGLATNIPTHNLSEVIEGTIAMIKKPTISLAELMK